MIPWTWIAYVGAGAYCALAAVRSLRHWRQKCALTEQVRAEEQAKTEEPR